MRNPVGRWPVLSGPNKDGSTHIGVRVLPDAAAQIRAQGHNLVNKMYERSVNRAEVARLRIGDVVDVRFDGDKGWWVYRGETRLGRLTWTLSSFESSSWKDTSPRIDEGTLQVIRLVLDEDRSVMNAGGIVRRTGQPIPSVADAVPKARVAVPTLHGAVGRDGSVKVTRQDLPPNGRRSIRSRLLGR